MVRPASPTISPEQIRQNSKQNGQIIVQSRLWNHKQLDFAERV
jgi:hypothetical protein